MVARMLKSFLVVLAPVAEWVNARARPGGEFLAFHGSFVCPSTTRSNPMPAPHMPSPAAHMVPEMPTADSILASGRKCSPDWAKRREPSRRQHRTLDTPS